MSQYEEAKDGDHISKKVKHSVNGPGSATA